MQILLISGLLGLLAALGSLQYFWLGKISESEKEQMAKRLKSDTERFAQDFNKEVAAISFALQMNGAEWKSKNWASFASLYDDWVAKSNYPKLIKEIYYLPKEGGSLKFDPHAREFIEIDWDSSLSERFGSANNPIESLFTIVSPIVDRPIPMKVPKPEAGKEGVSKSIVISSANISTEKIGTLIILLDEATIKGPVFSALANNYFPGGEYDIAIINKKDGALIFRNNEGPAPESDKFDASTPIFDSKADGFTFLVNKAIRIADREATVIAQDIHKGNFSISNSSQALIKTSGNKEDFPGIFERKTETSGRWLLNVTHKAGSLDEFVNIARRRNLGISFGILSLLAASIVLIFISAQRAKNFARRQVEFVSSVSHEFRTPLAVIYSAGENLTDGVIDSNEKIADYGNLIKREGKKLSGMVEQILEFAGADSGKKKYKFENLKASSIIENALSECRSGLSEKGITINRDIAENLPIIKADSDALSHAIQNLITNAIKYSNGSKQINISARNGDGKLKITVEDKGIGISKGDLKHIFEPFYRSREVVDSQIHGNGLGLSLVKQIVEAHGGKIYAESEKGKGSRFTIELRQASGE